MATGNLKNAQRHCKACGKRGDALRNGMVWGVGDFLLVLLTGGLWVPVRFAMNAISNPWRCQLCGGRC